MKTVEVKVDRSLTKVIGLVPAALACVIFGIVFKEPGVLVVGGVLAIAVLISVWAMTDTEKKCGGQWTWHGNNELEVYIGVCNSCDRWSIRVRGTAVAGGKGFEKFEAAAEDIALRYESSVPAIANEFRRLLARLQDDTPPPEEGFATESET